MPRFSVIIPVYNVEEYLEGCVSSVVSQTYEDIEIILVDDGATDGCPAICDALAQKDGRIKVIHKKNGGLSDARNAGIDKAVGEYILFLDSDDYWSDASVLGEIAKRLEITGADVLSFNYHKTDGEKDSPVYFQGKRDMPRELSGRDSFVYQTDNDLWIACSWNKCTKRELYENGELRFVKGIPFEDIDWCVRLALKAQSFDYMDMDTVAYRQRPGSISQSPTAKKIEILIGNTKMSLDILERAEDREKADLIKPYMGYQCATLLFTVSELDSKEERLALLEKSKGFLPLLAYSKNRKVKVVRAASRLFGLKAASYLMHKLFKMRHR